MIAPIRCRGRVFPNGPANSRVGCDRRSPYAFQVTYADGNGPYHFHEFEDLNIRWSGNPTPGRNVRCNWNLDAAEYPGSGLSINVNLRHPFIGSNQYIVEVDFKGGFPVLHQEYRLGPMDFVVWEDFLDGINVPIADATAPRPWINNEVVVLRIGTYLRLPADTCIVETWS